MGKRTKEDGVIPGGQLHPVPPGSAFGSPLLELDRQKSQPHHQTRRQAPQGIIHNLPRHARQVGRNVGAGDKEGRVFYGEPCQICRKAAAKPEKENRGEVLRRPKENDPVQGRADNGVFGKPRNRVSTAQARGDQAGGDAHDRPAAANSAEGKAQSQWQEPEDHRVAGQPHGPVEQGGKRRGGGARQDQLGRFKRYLPCATCAGGARRGCGLPIGVHLSPPQQGLHDGQSVPAGPSHPS